MSDLSNASILVVGIARNCGATIRDDISKIGAALSGARRVQWCIVESDSADATGGHLRVLEATIPDFKAIFLGDLRHKLQKRTERIAFCRNRYLDELPNYPDVDYVFVSDLDGACKLLTAQAVESCFTRNDWDACCANQRGPYYDIYALRSHWSQTDCLAELYRLQELGIPEAAARKIAIFSKMVTIPENAEWVHVDSAYGGTAIYKRGILEGGRYVGVDSDGYQNCEHIALHSHLLRNNKLIFINPAFINTDWNEHSREVVPSQRAYRARIRLLLRAKAVKRAIKDAVVACGFVLLGQRAEKIGTLWRKFRPLPNSIDNV